MFVVHSVELEKQALVELYDATEGPNWGRNNNWLTSKPIGEWDGITVDSAGHVIELSLGMNNLKGRSCSKLWFCNKPMIITTGIISHNTIQALYRIASGLSLT